MHTNALKKHLRLLLLPLVFALLGLTAFVVDHKINHSQSLTHQQDTIAQWVVQDTLVHLLQAEQAYSNAYLNSSGQRYAQALFKQRSLTDIQLLKLSPPPSQHYASSAKSLSTRDKDDLPFASNLLSDLTELRGNIDKLNLNQQQLLSSFTLLTEQLITSLDLKRATLSKTPSLATNQIRLTAYEQLQQAKAAGAKAWALLASDYTNTKLKAQSSAAYEQAIATQQQLFRLIAQAPDAELQQHAQQYLQQYLGSTSQDGATAALPQVMANADNLATVFSNVAKQQSQLKQWQDEFNQQLIKQIATQSKNNNRQLFIIFITGLLGCGILSIMYQQTCKYINRLQDKVQRLSKFKMIVDNSPNAIFIGTADNVIEYCNQSAVNITGYKKKQIIGKKPSLWSAKKSTEVSYDEIIATGKAGKVWQGELLNHHSSGHSYWARTVFFPVKSDSGALRNFITIEQDITQQKQAQDKIRFLANHDALTGLPSLRLGKDRLDQAILAAIRHKLTMALMFVDLDGFKAVNDQYGHKAGDSVLKEVGQRMVSTTRNTDTIARIGGDEFMVVLTNVKEPAAISRVATKMLNSIKAPYHFQGVELTIGASIGIVLCPDQGTTSSVLLQKADKAMYQVKKSGKNNFAYFVEEKISAPT